MQNQAVSREFTAGDEDGGHVAGLGAVGWLSFAAAPTFAIMALLSAASGGGAPEIMCSATHGASPLSGMALMYVLMAAFHSAPWLKLIAGRRNRTDIE